MTSHIGVSHADNQFTTIHAFSENFCPHYILLHLLKLVLTYAQTVINYLHNALLRWPFLFNNKGVYHFPTTLNKHVGCGVHYDDLTQVLTSICQSFGVDDNPSIPE